MPPEMIDGSELIGKYCDYYSFGILMYELLTGIPPFIGANIQDVFARIKLGQINYPGFISNDAKNLISVILTIALIYLLEFYFKVT